MNVFPMYGSVQRCKLDIYGEFRVGDSAVLFGGLVTIRSFEVIPGGTSVAVTDASGHHWTTSASNLRPVPELSL